MGIIKRILNFHRLRKNITLSETKIRTIQHDKFLKLMKYVYDNSPYYHVMLASKGFGENNLENITLDDIETIDKKKFISNFDDIVTNRKVSQKRLREIDKDKDKNKSGMYLVHSSGSTGLPAYFVYDDGAWNTMQAGILRAALWGMSNLDILKLLWQKPRILYIAATEGSYAGNTAVYSGVENLGFKQLHLSVQLPLGELIRKINDFKPQYIIGYPSAIKILASLSEQEKLNIQISRAITCGEPLSDAVCKYIKEVFKCNVINVYGASESMALGVSGDTDDGMYLFDDLNIVEQINGKVYLTNLYNFVQPIIRYELGDEIHFQVSANRERCAFSKIKVIDSRSEDILWFADFNGKKEYLHPLSIEGVCVDGLLDYQFCKSDKTTLEMNVEIQKGYSKDWVCESIKEIIYPILKQKKLDYLQFYVNVVNEIKPDKKTGKKKLILDLTGECL